MDWYYLKDGQPLGPVGEGSIRAWLESGFLRPGDLLWRNGLAEWTPAWQLTEFTSAERSPAGPAASPPGGSDARSGDPARPNGPPSGSPSGGPEGDPAASVGGWSPGAPPAWTQQSGPLVSPGAGAPSIVFAGFWLRVGAAMIDWIFLSIVMMLVFHSQFSRVMAMTGEMAGFETWRQAIEMLNADRFLVAFSLVSPWLYFAAMESSPWQATLGKKAFRIRVCSVTGARLGPIRATLRHLIKIVLMDLTFALTLVPAAFTRYRQGLHDMAAGTLVVRE